MDGDQVFDSERYQTTRDLEFSFSLPDTQHYSDLTDPVEIRIYGYSGQWGGHKTSLMDFKLSGKIIYPEVSEGGGWHLY
jgi:hypothetical protein